MKMGTGLFWGILLVLIGAIMIINVVFKINLPVVKLILAFIFIYLGVRLLLGKGFQCSTKTEKDVAFSEQTFIHDGENTNEYNVVFGKGIIDLRSIPIKTDQPSVVKVNTAFGASEVWVDKSKPYRIKVNTAFSGVNLPNGSTSVLGTNVYKSAGADTAVNYIDIRADIAFGALRIVEY